MLEPGQPAPSFTLLDQGGTEVSLESFRGRPVLVYFYPRASTPGCTTQACGLRDALPDLGGAAVVGISPDEPAALKRFDEEHQLGFPLLSDPDHGVAEAYGAWGEKSMYGRRYHGVIRSAFLVDDAGILSHVWYRVSPKDTPVRLRKAVGA